MTKSIKSDTSNNLRYQDYVIKDGKYVGRFEEMYSECQEIPWNQDETAIGICTDLDLSVLRHMNARHSFERIADIGCGLGYVTARINAEVLGGGGWDNRLRCIYVCRP